MSERDPFDIPDEVLRRKARAFFGLDVPRGGKTEKDVEAPAGSDDQIIIVHGKRYRRFDPGSHPALAASDEISSSRARRDMYENRSEPQRPS